MKLFIESSTLIYFYPKPPTPIVSPISKSFEFIIRRFMELSLTKFAGNTPTSFESIKRPVHQPLEPDTDWSLDKTSSLPPRL